LPAGQDGDHPHYSRESPCAYMPPRNNGRVIFLPSLLNIGMKGKMSSVTCTLLC